MLRLCYNKVQAHDKNCTKEGKADQPLHFSLLCLRRETTASAQSVIDFLLQLNAAGCCPTYKQKQPVAR